MGVFNTLVLERDGDADHAQFKYAFRRLIDYRIGDRIRWDTTDRPAAADGTVIVTGLGWTADRRWMRDWAIRITGDVIMDAVEITGSAFDALEAAERAASMESGIGYPGLAVTSDAPAIVQSIAALP